jgi:hypothetical protein
VADFAWHVRVRSTGRGRSTAYVRQHQFVVGEPIQFDAESDAVAGLEYVLGVLGADLVAGLRRAARRRRVPVDHVEALVTGTLGRTSGFGPLSEAVERQRFFEGR